MRLFRHITHQSNNLMPTIGVAGVTIPGALDCINKINQISRLVFKEFQHPNIKLEQPDFSLIHDAQEKSAWQDVTDILVKSICVLAESGANFAIIPANTVHRVIHDVQVRSSIPVLNMLDIVANECRRHSFKKVAVLGTRWTMADHLYKNTFSQRNLIEVTPSGEDQLIIQKAIFSELIPHGSASKETLTNLLKIVQKMENAGCDSVALACTELPLILNSKNCNMPVLDTNYLLAQAAINESISLLNKPTFNVHTKNA